ncbi:MAG: nucleotidyltransferase family protein [Acidobacteria bacterium]|nr:nucleotidyltransferase family protein [Acidobacteriota bacterium]
MAETAIIILAAGQASRMGRPKQLLDFGGRPLVRHAAETALAAELGPVVVVTGAYQQQVEAALADLPVRIAFNPRWEEGIGTSIQAGLAVLSEDTAGLILTLADLPLLTAGTYRRLVEIHGQSGPPIVAAAYEGTVGVPVYFARPYFAHLAALAPAAGCKGVILKHPHDAYHEPCPEAATDVDTAEDYAHLCATIL